MNTGTSGRSPTHTNNFESIPNTNSTNINQTMIIDNSWPRTSTAGCYNTNIATTTGNN
jgi:hypothetical protein